jgi:hypothetical protein
MPFIPRQVKPPARIAITCKLPQQVATLLKCYAEFLESSQDYVVTEIVQLACRKDREFQAWLATAHPDTAVDSKDPATALHQPTTTTEEVRPRRSRAGRVESNQPAASPRASAPGRQEP